MASLIRLRNISSLRKLTAPSVSGVRSISTSDKKRETAILDNTKRETKEEKEVDKNWISYGFDLGDKVEDRNGMHSIFFASISLCLVIGGTVWAYMPDYSLTDWAQREAYLEIRRREKLGLPYIDPNFVDPKNFTLPTDEELGDMEIVI